MVQLASAREKMEAGTGANEFSRAFVCELINQLINF